MLSVSFWSSPKAAAELAVVGVGVGVGVVEVAGEKPSVSSLVTSALVVMSLGVSCTKNKHVFNK